MIFIRHNFNAFKTGLGKIIEKELFLLYTELEQITPYFG